MAADPPIVALGELLWDLLPAGPRAGGAPFNFAFHCHQLGHPAVIVSRVGDDQLGRQLKDEVRRLGLSDEYIQTDPEHPTGTVQVSVDAGGQPAYTITERVAWDFMEWGTGLEELAKFARAVCFGTLAQRAPDSRSSIRRFVAQVRCLRILDLNLRPPFDDPETIRESLDLADWLKLNAEESGRLPSDFDPSSMELVCVTRGAAGCSVRTPTEVVDLPGIPVRVADTVGAGDAFTAALLTQHLEGKPLREAARFANAYAAVVASKVGGTPAVTRADVETPPVTLDWTPLVLETDRLVLRPIVPADATAVFLYASNPAVTRFTLFETHQTIDESRWFAEEYTRSRYANREPDPFGIVLKADPLQTVVGALGTHWASQPNLTMEFGYSLAEPYWGRGLIAEAAVAVIRYVFEEYAVERLQAQVFVGNDASERVLQKLGFTREGVLRSLVLRRGQWWDIVMYSLLRAEWEERRVVGRPDGT